MLKVGYQHAHAGDDCVNKPGYKVGDGIYISPYFSTSLKEYTDKGDDYRVVLQCRFKP
jgi:hypothetical protein